MILPVLFQGGLFLSVVAAGFLLAFFYDIFRVFRRIVPHSAIFIHLEDTVYWITVVAVMFYFLLEANSGEIRFFSIAGVFIGMFSYFKLLSPLFLKFSMTIYIMLKRAALLLFSIIAAPFKALFLVMSFPARYLAGKAKAAHEYEKRMYMGIKIRGRNRARKLKNDFGIILKKI